ncbi:MAG: hypothetical protein Q9157_003283 [Trypethelium eluteriae]
MPSVTLNGSTKHVLTDSTNKRTNIQTSPRASKKLKTEAISPVSTLKAPPRVISGRRIGSSQPKSQFEEEVLEKLTQDINGLKENNSETDQRWARPKLDSFDEKTNTLCFQQIDVEAGSLDGGKTTVKLFGVTEEGHSVLLHVTDFLSYFYIAAPISFTKHDCEGYKVFLESRVAEQESVIHSVQMVMRENVFGFQGNQKSPYLKITMTAPKYMNQVRGMIEENNANYKGYWNGIDKVLTFDHILYILRFMIDCKISGMSWVEVPAGKFKLLPDRDRQSNCQIEARVHYRDLIAHPTDGEWAKMAPLRVLSFDIECAGRKGIFPDAEIDPVIQIANIVTRYGEEKPFVRNVFCLNSCSPIVSTQIFEYDKEEKMLMGWRDFLEEVDPDVIIGYNIANFDLTYLLDRARQLKCTRFPYWSRLRNTMSKVESSKFSSKQMGNRESKAINTNGRIQLDLLQLIQRDHHLRSYTLNSVCAHFLNEQKEDVHHTMITELFNGTPESRRRLAVYCLKDAYLPQRLMDKLMCLINYTEMARVTGVPFNYLLARGQQVRFISQLFRKALEQQLVIPHFHRSDSSTDEQYEGATVIEPVRGYYDVPVATLDFASLYPSIMQAHNLCYTTLLNKTAVDKLGLKKDEDYIVTPNNDMFCTSKVRKGLLSQILEELLGARKRAKKELAVETDFFKKAVLNGRQLALKVSANSVYGLTGATVGKLPCLAIASSTTSYGRQMIEKTKEEVERQYTIANGYSHDAQVIYGDTDSVMVKFGPNDISKCMELGQEAANFVSTKFIKPIKLEFEKVYFPYLLINKKRYAGLYYTKPTQWDKMDSKGIETVRRDNCRLVQTVIETSLRMLLIDRDIQGAQDYVKETIADLLQNKIDMSNLVITKALAKSDYAAKQAHVELAERMKKRDAGSAPALGDRVAYVIVKGAGDARNYEKSEDPIYVLENNLPIDTKYYLDNQLAKPLGRIFEPILGEKKAGQLLTGEHTRSISVAAPTMGGLMKFAKKTQTCMGCKRPLKGSVEAAGAVCEDCRPRFGELYTKTLGKVSELEVRFARLWTQCQRCQGSMHCEVICSSRDCPIFYMRMKAKKDVEDAGKELVRFDRDATIW